MAICCNRRGVWTEHLTRHLFSFTARTCNDVWYHIGSSVGARHSIHVSCAWVIVCSLLFPHLVLFRVFLLSLPLLTEPWLLPSPPIEESGPLANNAPLTRFVQAQKNISRWKNKTLDVEGDAYGFACELLQENWEGLWTEGLRKARASGTIGTRRNCGRHMAIWQSLITLLLKLSDFKRDDNLGHTMPFYGSRERDNALHA